MKRKSLPIALLLLCSVVWTTQAAIHSTKRGRARNDIGNCVFAVKIFREDVGRYPTQEEGLKALESKPDTLSADVWRGPYITFGEDRADPWGNEYRYIYPLEGKQGPYGVYSLGPDGATSSSGNDDDDMNSSDPDSPRTVARARKRKYVAALSLGIIALVVVVLWMKRKGPNKGMNADK